MMENILNFKEIDMLKSAGKFARLIIRKLKEVIRPKISTKDVENFVDDFFDKYEDYKPAFKGYMGYPSSICISVNEEVIHGIPKREKIIQEGDIVSVDLGVHYKGVYVDTAYTYPVGKVSEDKLRIIEVCRNALYEAIKRAKVGYRVGDISFSVQSYVENNGFSVIRDFVGHGIGKDLHLPPQIPNFGQAGVGDVLRENMGLAIEPMICAGDYKVEVLEDGWTVRTKDNSISAHFEHTVVVTKNKPIIVT